MSTLELSEQEQIRRNSLQEIIKLGINPFPADEYPVSHYSGDILSRYDEESNKMEQVCVAGRIMTRRIMGNASFI